MSEKIQLLPVEILSCYKNKGGSLVNLPPKMAFATPRMREAIYLLRERVAARGARLALSDLFRSPDMQQAAHERYLAGLREWEAKGSPAGGKPKFSPASGGSFHEAGEAMDVVLRDLLPLAGGRWDRVLDEFWPLAKACGFRPIIAKPEEGASEAWHFDFWDGAREELYREKGYKAAAAIAIEARALPW